MKFLADECCDAAMVAFLKQDGHDVLYVMEDEPGALGDKDYGELVYSLKKPARGIILIRIEVKERHLKWRRLKKLINNYGSKIEGSFVVVDIEKFRFRPLYHDEN